MKSAGEHDDLHVLGLVVGLKVWGLENTCHDLIL